MSDNDHTRRSVLRRAGTAVGAGALASVAGCVDSLPGLGSGGTSYETWLPEPDTVTSGDHSSFWFLDTATFESNEDELDDSMVDTLESIEQVWQPVGVDWDETSTILLLDNVVPVVEADFETEDVVDDLEDEDFDEDDEYEGYRLFERDTRGFAVGNGRLIAIGQFIRSEDPIDDLEAIIDVNNGEEDRYVDEVEEMSVLVDELGNGTSINGRTLDAPDEPAPEQGVFDEMVAEGHASSINGETADETYVIVYDSEDDVDLDDLEDWVDENDGSDQQFDDLDDIEYTQKGRKGVITGTLDTDEI